MKAILRSLLPVVAVIQGCGAADPVPAVEPDLVLVDVTVIDGSGAPPRPGQTIAVANGRIIAIRPTRPGDSATIDVAGSFVTPGLIDSHVHLPSDRVQLSAALDSMLRLGITSAREMGSTPEHTRIMLDGDTARLTRLYASAYWAGPTFMRDDLRVRDAYAQDGQVPWRLAVTDTTDLDAALRAAREHGMTALKIYSDMEPALVADAIAAARAAGMPVWSHAVIFPMKPSLVAASGVAVISHAAFFVWEVPPELPATYNGSQPWTPFGPSAPYSTVSPGDPAIVAVLETMRQRGVILDPTITVMRALDDESRAWAIDLTRRAHAMGIPLSTGTDTFSLFDEIEALVDDVGLSALQAIRSATAVGAAAIGVSEDFGSVEVGKVADMVVYAADPSADITALRRPAHVIRGGRLIHSGS